MAPQAFTAPSFSARIVRLCPGVSMPPPASLRDRFASIDTPGHRLDSAPARTTAENSKTAWTTGSCLTEMAPQVQLSEADARAIALNAQGFREPRPALRPRLEDIRRLALS